MTLHFQLSLQCNVLPITGFVRHTAKKKKEVATYILVLWAMIGQDSEVIIESEESFVGVLDCPK